MEDNMSIFIDKLTIAIEALRIGIPGCPDKDEQDRAIKCFHELQRLKCKHEKERG